MQTGVNVKQQLFDTVQIRTAWDEAQEKWWFSALDVVAALTDQSDYPKARNYWKWLKGKTKQEGSEVVSATHPLKLEAETGMKLTPAGAARSAPAQSPAPIANARSRLACSKSLSAGVRVGQPCRWRSARSASARIQSGLSLRQSM